ncbi:MAG: hypothetical protein WEB03_09865 [Nitriliruptor sp.]|uniref:hypothetical protein n=1 Tax=Nitriliruptor sp. TaxID=2448056 RepID=UPI0034A088D4
MKQRLARIPFALLAAGAAGLAVVSRVMRGSDGHHLSRQAVTVAPHVQRCEVDATVTGTRDREVRSAGAAVPGS